MNERIEKIKKQSKKDLYISFGTVISTGSAWYGLHSLASDMTSLVSESGVIAQEISSRAIWIVLGEFEPFFIFLFIVSVLYFFSELRTYLRDRRV